MIYEFTVENFRSFSQAQTLNLVKHAQRHLPDNAMATLPGFPPVVRAAAIFGHNASGKSNFVRAGYVFWDAVTNSATNPTPAGFIRGIEPHRLDPLWQRKPTRFELVFSMGERVFRYGFAALPQKIVAESLSEELRHGKARRLFERSIRTQGDAANVEFSSDEFDGAAKDNVPKLTRDDALVLSSGANLNVPLLRNIRTLIARNPIVMSLSPFGPGVALQMARSIRDENEFRDQLAAVLRDADIGITGLHLGDPPAVDLQIVEHFKRVFTPQHGERAGEMALQQAKQMVQTQVRVLAQHRRTDDQSVDFDWQDESQGTQVFAQLFWLAFRAFKEGHVVVVDELGANIHPLLAARFIELFQNPENNKNGAQLVFTTHLSQLMSPSLLRKDQLWIAEKTPEGSTEIFSLADFRGEKYTRSSEAFEKNYLAGRYRGVGGFGPRLSGMPLEPAPRTGNGSGP